MQGPDNPADQGSDDGWEIVSQRLDQTTGEWELGWKRRDEDEPTRWLRSNMGMSASGIRIDGYGADVFINLPAEVRSRQQLDERAGGRVWRSSSYEVVARIEREIGPDGDVRAVVDSVSVRRLGTVGVTSGVLRFNLGELVDWSLTRAPVSERSGDASSFLGPGHPAAADALRASRRKTGKRGPDVVSVEAVAEVVRNAPPRRQGAALAEAFPNVARSTLQAALKLAREQDPTLHTARSRAAADRLQG
jgi:hypothetical protein